MSRPVGKTVAVGEKPTDQQLMSVRDKPYDGYCQSLRIGNVVWFGTNKTYVPFITRERDTWNQIQVPVQSFYEQPSGRAVGTGPLRLGYPSSDSWNSNNHRGR